MTTGILYIFQPKVNDLPPGQSADLAWFVQFSSGHFRHADQRIVEFASQNGIPNTVKTVPWAEYQRLLAEAHWYE